MQEEPRPAPPGSDDRLDSWKEIAAYLRKGVRTVQRWERTENLPVRRHGQGSVFAYRSELDAWWRGQGSPTQAESEPDSVPDAAPQTARRRWLISVIAVSACIVSGLLIWKMRPAESVVYRPVPLTSDQGSEMEPAFSPDGSRIAYVWMTEGKRPTIFVRNVSGGAPVRLTGGTAGEDTPAWSPDGRTIAFFRYLYPEGSLMLIPSGGGKEIRIGDFPGLGFLHWSPDGQWLICGVRSGRERSIVAVSAASGAKHALVEPYEFGYQVAGISPDQRRLVYLRNTPGRSTVYEQFLGPGLRPEGPPRQVTARLFARDAILTPSGDELIYTDSDWYDGLTGVWRLPLTRGATPRLIHTNFGKYSDLAISRDGQRLAFSVSQNDRENTWKLSLDRPNEPPSPLLASTHSDLNPQYSPDGNYIAFHSTRSGASDIWIAANDGSNPWRLTYTDARTTATPRWSPNGEWIAFESNQSGHTEVYVVRSTGGPIRRLTDNNPAVDAIPEWSRDGRFIYFCSDRTGRFEVWKMPAGGGDPVQVTRDGGFSAVESTDGKYLYYSVTRNYGPVMRVPLAGGEPVQIISELRGLFYAVSPRGIYFRSPRAISFWDASSGKITEVLKPPKPTGVGMAISPDGKTLLFTQIELGGRDLYMIDGLR